MEQQGDRNRKEPDKPESALRYLTSLAVLRRNRATALVVGTILSPSTRSMHFYSRNGPLKRS